MCPGVGGVVGGEEGLVVVLGQLGQAGDHLLHRQVGHLTGPPAPGTHQPRLLQVILSSVSSPLWRQELLRQQSYVIENQLGHPRWFFMA